MSVIIEGQVEPQLGDRERKEELDNEYSKPLTTSLKDQKASAMDIYKPKQNKVLEKNEVIDNNKKIDENPNTPIINLFIKKGLLNNNEGKLIKESLIKPGDIIDNLNSIEGLNLEKVHNISSSIEFLEKKETKSYNMDKFNNEFQNEIKEFKIPNKLGKNSELDLFGQDKKLIDKLGGNYFEIGNEKLSDDMKGTLLDTSFKKTLNELMKGKQFKRSDSLDKMLGYVNDNKLTFKERFNNLKKVDTLINDDQSRSNGKQSKSFNRRTNLAYKENISLEDRFNDFKKELKIAKQSRNFKKLEELVEISKLLINEYEESGDIFKASEIDILKVGIEDTLLEQN